MRKRLIAMLAFVFILPFQTPSAAAWDSYFDDVLIGNSYYSDIYHLSKEGDYYRLYNE